ncbi:hypothetical protein MCERHM32_00150 [Methylophilaceae bacterium]
MVDWSKTKLIEFMSHSKCQQDEACEALAGFDYPVNSSRKSELWKLWLQNNLLSQLSWQSTEEFIDLAIKNGYPPPWLGFAIERGLYTPKQIPEVALGTSINDEIIQANQLNKDAADKDEELSALFDPVTPAALEKMFAANNKWQNWAKRAGRNGLDGARQGRGMYNPLKAAKWFLKQRCQGWDLARCWRTLEANLPSRSKDNAHLLRRMEE